MADSSPFRTSLHRLDEATLRAPWYDLLDRSEQATVFSDLAVGAAVENELGFAVLLACVWADDELVAGAMLFEKRRGPFRSAALPPFVQYVTPLLATPLRETDVHHQRSAFDALADLIRSSFDQASLVLHPSLTDTRVLQWSGWQVEPAFTYRSALGAREKSTSGWSGSTRRTFENEAQHFTIDEGDHVISEALGLVQASHERQGYSIGMADETFQAFTRTLAMAGLLRVFVARREAQPAAGLFVPSDGRTAHYWIAGSEPGAAMTVLVGEVLTRLHDSEHAYFDFAGANVPSIAEFKRKFGGVLVPYARARCVTHPALRLADRLRSR